MLAVLKITDCSGSIGAAVANGVGVLCCTVLRCAAHVAAIVCWLFTVQRPLPARLPVLTNSLPRLSISFAIVSQWDHVVQLFVCCEDPSGAAPPCDVCRKTPWSLSEAQAAGECRAPAWVLVGLCWAVFPALPRGWC